MPLTVSEKGRREAASRARTSGTIVSIKERGVECTVRCEDHGQQTTAVKWSVACEVARRPAEFCSACKQAGPPAPKPKREHSKPKGVAPSDQTPQEREEYLRQAHEARARERREAAERDARAAREALPQARRDCTAAYREYERARRAAQRAWSKWERLKPDTAKYIEAGVVWRQAEDAVDRAQSRALAASARVRKLESQANAVVAN